MNYYISDLHFGHEKIIALCNRPYSSVKVMNDDIIQKINAVVSEKDTLYILGDVSCYNYYPVKRLNQIGCRKILIPGNHDKHWLNDEKFKKCFDQIKQTMIIKDGQYKIFLSHYPMAEWDGYFKGIYHFYGHVHNSKIGGAVLMQLHERAVNVCLDQIGMPKTAGELIQERKRNFDSTDFSELIMKEWGMRK